MPKKSPFEEFLDATFDIFKMSPWWLGPILIGVTFPAIYWRLLTIVGSAAFPFVSSDTVWFSYVDLADCSDSQGGIKVITLSKSSQPSATLWGTPNHMW